MKKPLTSAKSPAAHGAAAVTRAGLGAILSSSLLGQLDRILTMCGRYRLSRADLLAAAMNAVPPFEGFSEKGRTLRMEFKPADYVPIVHLEGTRRVIDVAYSGFVPSWAGGDAKVKPINAKSETVANSGMFRSAFKSHRCLIPADGFFEPKGRRR